MCSYIVALGCRGEAVMSDSDYEKLKNDLLAQDSWVVSSSATALLTFMPLHTLYIYNVNIGEAAT